MKTSTSSVSLVCVLITTFVLAKISFAQESDALGAWRGLIQLKPNIAELEASRKERGGGSVEMSLQDISAANSSKINLDEYAVEIDRLPNGTPSIESLFREIRSDLGSFLDAEISTFEGYEEQDVKDWKNARTAPIGAVLLFRIRAFGVLEEQAAVVTSASTANAWVFSPVTIGASFPGQHPVSGNREFGIRKSSAVGQIYTRGADRAIQTGLDSITCDEDCVFDGGDRLWRSFQDRVKAFVETKGGVARILPPTIHRIPWDDSRIKALTNG